MHDKIDETDLTFRDISRNSVAELLYWKSVYFFEIALSEELNEEQICPVAAQTEVFGWVRNVGQVKHELYEKFLVFRIACIEIVIIHTSC